MEFRIQILLASILLIIGSCTEDPCLKSSGDDVVFELEMDNFNSVEIHDRFEVEFIQSTDTLIRVITKSNLSDFLNIQVEDNWLYLKDDNTCNFLREYNTTKVQIFHPNIARINNLGSNRTFSSDTLYYEKLFLYSSEKTGDFDFIVNNKRTTISINNISNVNLSGKTDYLYIGIFASDGRVDAKGLIATTVEFFHRGTNDALVYPVDKLKGQFVGLGDVIYYNTPILIDISSAHYPGKAIPAD